MSEPRISTVIPAYNAGRFLMRSVSSVLAQTCPPDEVIVVDDGSNDDTAQVAAGFGPPVRCVRQANAGASAARNRGIQEAAGDYVAFLDADDEWLPRHLENCVNVLHAHPDVAWFCDAFEIRMPSGSGSVRRDYDSFAKGGCIDEALIGAAQCPFGMDSMVIRRSVFADVGSFEASLRVGEDLDLWFRIALRYPRIGYSSETGAVYHLHADSLTGRTLKTPDTYLAGIKRHELLARESGPEAVRRCEPLMWFWVAEAVRRAVKSGSKPVLRKMAQDYGDRIPVDLRVVSFLCRLMPGNLWRPVFGLIVELRRVLTFSGSHHTR